MWHNNETFSIVQRLKESITRSGDEDDNTNLVDEIEGLNGVILALRERLLEGLTAWMALGYPDSVDGGYVNI